MVDRKPPSDSTIIAAFWWFESASHVAWKLNTNSRHVRHIWSKAKEDGRLPKVKRPHGGFDHRSAAFLQGMRVA